MPAFRHHNEKKFMTATKNGTHPPNNHRFNVKHESMGASRLKRLKDICVIHEQRIIWPLPSALSCILATFVYTHCPWLAASFMPWLCLCWTALLISTTGSSKNFTFLLLICPQFLKGIQIHFLYKRTILLFFHLFYPVLLGNYFTSQFYYTSHPPW